MQRRAMSLLLLLLFINCHHEEEELLDGNFTVHNTGSEKTRAATDGNRIRVKNIEALREIPIPNRSRKEATVLGYYEPHDGGGGVFVWKPESTENDNGGTTIAPIGEVIGRWERSFEGAVNVKWFGAREGIQFDNANIFQNVFELNKISNVDIEVIGRYNIESTLYLSDINGLEVRGDAGSEIYTSQVIKLFTAKRNSSLKNFTVRGIKFSNYAESSKAFFDLFFFEEVCLENINFINCEFTAPTINSNALKFINQNTCSTENILISHCYFRDIGRMGVEFQNHNFLDPQIRYRNIKVQESSFINVGKNSYGMGVSLSGMGADFIAKQNIFSGYTHAGIEIVGCSNNEITENHFAGGTGGGIIMSGRFEMVNTKIFNNYSSTVDDGNFLFSNVEGISFRGNHFRTKGYFKFRNAQEVQFMEGNLESSGNYCVYLENCKNFLFINSSLDNSLSLNNFSVIRTFGDSFAINLSSSVLKKGLGGVYYDGIFGAEYPQVFDVSLQ